MLRPPVVVHVIDSLRTGGAQWMLAALAGGLTEAGLARVVVVSATADGADRALVQALEGATDRLVVLDAHRLADRRFLTGVLGAARGCRADLIHSHLVGAAVNGRLAAAVLRIPHVTTIHTPPGGSEDSRARISADGWTARASSLLIAPGAAVAEAYAHAWHVPRSRFAVVASAPPMRERTEHFDRGAMRTQLGVAPDELMVLSVTRLEPAKGVDVLLEAAAGLEGVRVVVAGDGPQRSALDADGARLLGHRSDVGDLLAASDVFCLPSLHEALPVSVLEAMAAGLPVVASKVGALPDLLGGGAGFLVAPGDSAELRAVLAGLEADRTAAAGRSEAGRRRVEQRHGSRAVALAHAELYSRVLSGGAPQWRA